MLDPVDALGGLYTEPGGSGFTLVNRQCRADYSSVSSPAMKASWEMLTEPIVFIRFLPFFCFSSSLRVRVAALGFG